MMATKPDYAKREVKPGQRRLEWLATITGIATYSRLGVQIAGLLAWKYSDAKTAETFAGLDALMADTKAEKRAVLGVMAQLRKDGFLLKIRAHAPKRPSTYRLIVPAAQPDQKAPAAIPRNWTKYVPYAVDWINAERDDAKVKARWESASEKKIRNEICDGNVDLSATCKSMLEQRLRYGKCRMFEEGDVPC